MVNMVNNFLRNNPQVLHNGGNMRRTHTQALTDVELRRELEAGDTIFFIDRPLKWQEIERQVERLGFGELYIVSAMQRPNENPTISLKPVQPKQSPQSQAAA
jgi:hypothetical protein